MRYSCPQCMASFQLPDAPGVPDEVRCKYCGQRISLAAAAPSTPAPAPRPRARVTADNQAVRLRVPTAVRRLGFEPRPADPVDEDGATCSEPIPEALVALDALASGHAAAAGARPPTARERPIPSSVVSGLPTEDLPSPPESEQPTVALGVPDGAQPARPEPSEAPTVMRRTPAGLARAAAPYRKTVPSVTLHPAQTRRRPRPQPRPGPGAAHARRGPPRPAPGGPSEPWVPSPALWAFVGALLGAALIALLFALFR